MNATSFGQLPIHKRVLFHLLFWAGYLIFFTLLGSDDEYKLTEALITELLRLPAKLIATYLTLYIFIPRFLLEKKYWEFAISIVATLIITGFIQRSVTYYLIYPIKYPSPLISYGAFFHGYRIVRGMLDINSVVVLASAIKIMKYWYITEQATKSLEREKLEAELKFLKAQIHPHFLFNTLNNLYALTLQKSDYAPQVVLKLAGLVNYMLYYTRAAEVSLSREIENIHNYIALEKIRYGDSLDIAFDVSGSISGTQISPMLLIPFVENSFKHGVSDEIADKWISINLNVTDRFLNFKIENSKSERKVDTEEKSYAGGIGLKNVRRRLELLYPEKFELKIYDEQSSYLVILKILLDSPTPL